MAIGTMTVKLPFDDPTSFGPYAATTWHFINRGIVSALNDAADQMRTAIINFYNDAPDGFADSVGKFMSKELSSVMHFSWVENLAAGSGPGSTGPVTYLPDSAIAAIPTTNLGLPNQMALCATQKCAPHDGLRRQSFYNRQYIGPLSITTLDEGGLAADDFCNLVREAGQGIADYLNELGLDSAEWVVYSRTDHSFGSITEWSVDNRYDVQRRRAATPTYTSRS